MKKIAIIGAGAIGSMVGGFLKLGGADVWFINHTPGHIDAVAEKGLLMKTNLGDHLVTGIHTAYGTEGLDVMDAVIILVKCGATQEAIEMAKKIMDEHTVVISFQSGVGHPEELACHFPADRIMYGPLHISSRITAPGEIFSILGQNGDHINLGALEKGPVANEMGEYLSSTLTGAGLNTRYVDDIDLRIWKKVLTNCITNCTCSVTRMNLGSQYNDPTGNGAALMEMIAREVGAVALAKGVDLNIEPFIAESLPAIVKRAALHYPSMAQDVVMHQKPTEIDFLNGKISEYGQELGIPTPANTVLTMIIRTIQANYQHQYKEGM